MYVVLYVVYFLFSCIMINVLSLTVINQRINDEDKFWTV